MAEATVDLSIYHYSNNNPINFNDPMGDVASFSDTYRDVNNNRWHGQNPHAGTALDGMVWGPFNMGLMPWELVGDWQKAMHGGGGSSSDNGGSGGGTFADAIAKILEAGGTPQKYKDGNILVSYWYKENEGKSLGSFDKIEPELKQGHYWFSLNEGNQGRVRSYLFGIDWYKWVQYDQKNYSTVIQGLGVTIIPDNPKQGAPITFSYHTVTVLAKSEAAKSGIASQLVNIAWNKTAQEIISSINNRKLWPLKTWVEQEFEKAFISNVRNSGLTIYLHTMPLNVKFDADHISFAKYRANLFQ
jgi:hypothetical protein